MKKTTGHKAAYRYTLWGALFGLCFPLIATVIESVQAFGATSPANIVAAQAQAPLLWIIDTAPVFLGLFAFWIGHQVDTVSEQSRRILQTQEQLIVQERMASIGQMTAGIAHEIKNPLNFITNFAEGSREIAEELREAIESVRDKFDPEKYDYLLELIDDLVKNSTDIRNSGQRADRIIHTLMDHTRGTAGELKSVNLNHLLDENINLAFHSYRARNSSFNLDIQKMYDDALTDVKVNPQSLGRVLLNIFNNACYALSQKQQEAGPDFSPLLTIQTRTLPEEVEIRIRDNGPGIPDDIRQNIFTPFFTTKPTGEGNTGLGLAISRDIVVQEHKGTLEFDSEPGQYTEFIIHLPSNET